MSQHLLHFIYTKNYKNLSFDNKVTLENLNIFIGSNGSGKSNFISCLKFLKDSLTIIPDESRGVSSFENSLTQIGGNRILDVNVKSPALVRFTYCFSQIIHASPRCPLITDSKILDLEIWELGDLYRVGDPSIGGCPW